jgi:hypothetical protein
MLGMQLTITKKEKRNNNCRTKVKNRGETIKGNSCEKNSRLTIPQSFGNPQKVRTKHTKALQILGISELSAKQKGSIELACSY